jgi:cytochrome P450
LSEEIAMTDTKNDRPSWPMARGCPLDPPPELATIQAENPVSRVNLWDGSTPWLITRYDDARAVLSDPRTSVNATLPGYPNLSVAFAARRTASLFRRIPTLALAVPFEDLTFDHDAMIYGVHELPLTW